MAVRSTEEFKAEVYRRRDAALKKREARKKAAKRALMTLCCVPLIFAAVTVMLSLAIALQPAGSADKNSNPTSSGAGGIIYVNAQTGYREELAAFFEKITSRRPQESGFKAEEAGEVYDVIIYEIGSVRSYKICEKYVERDGKIYLITEAEFEEFLEITEKKENYHD